jgi:hypothetical protein
MVRFGGFCQDNIDPNLILDKTALSNGTVHSFDQQRREREEKDLDCHGRLEADKVIIFV